MNIKFTGTGTSTGNPEIGCTCEVCTSNDRRDHRLRSSVLIKIDGKNILIDCGPDFRQQMLNVAFEKLQGVLITHDHYDHVGGLDDLRPFCRFGGIDIYGEERVCEALRTRFSYCFQDVKYPGVPNLSLRIIDNTPFQIEDIPVLPIRLMHGQLPILGYRIGNTAYLTDLKYIPEEEFVKLQHLDTLIINALRIAPHHSHQNLDDALANIRRIAPQKAYLIHPSHHIGLQAEVEKLLPKNVFLAYDGLEIESE
ncbi:MBL fold metallo-hydrolase [Viscerimonas tarda]